MIRNRTTTVLVTLFSAGFLSHAVAADSARLKIIADAAIAPVMKKNEIPGMAVAISVDGEDYLFNYGVASKDTNKPVDGATLFELGSISKTFTATLSAYAEVTGHLSMSDKVNMYLPSMKGRPFGEVALLNLGTHTAGGFPLQLPDDVETEQQLLSYLEAWKPSYPAGTRRTYANPSIGMLGYITAKAMSQRFERLMQDTLFPALGLSHTFIAVPVSKTSDYAQGYKRSGEPARLTAAMLSSEAYGVKSTATDLIRFVDANMGLEELDQQLQTAITNTHVGYFDVGAMTQGLIWEEYSFPTTLQTLLDGNSKALLKTVQVSKLVPPTKPRQDVWINKTGSTNGFGAYVAFIPERRLGIVILANKNYPNEDRVSAAYQILTALSTTK